MVFYLVALILLTRFDLAQLIDDGLLDFKSTLFKMVVGLSGHHTSSFKATYK